MKTAVFAMSVFFISLFSSFCNAELMIGITGVSESGKTEWTFSGSATAGKAGLFDFGAPAGNDSWNDVGDMFTSFYASATTPSTPLGATVTVNGQTRNIDELYIDHDTGLNDDELGIGVSGNSNLAFSDGDVVSWAGSFEFSADISNMNVGSCTDSDADFGGLDLTVNVSSVPEPTGALMFSIAIGVLGFRRRR